MLILLTSICQVVSVKVVSRHGHSCSQVPFLAGKFSLSLVRFAGQPQGVFVVLLFF